MNIKDLVTEAFDNAKAHGFHDPSPTMGEQIALAHSRPFKHGGKKL